MKQVIIPIINAVIEARNASGAYDQRTIQLSHVLMQQFVVECNYMIHGKDEVHENTKFNNCEVSYPYAGHVYNIVNRAYRDDTNDSDVELQMLKQLGDSQVKQM